MLAMMLEWNQTLIRTCFSFAGTEYIGIKESSPDAALDVSGDVEISGLLALDGTTQKLTGAGEVNATTSVTELATTGADALTIANGTRAQQIKVIVCITDGGTGTLTGANFLGTSLTFTDDGDNATLMCINSISKWACIGDSGDLFAP